MNIEKRIEGDLLPGDNPLLDERADRTTKRRLLLAGVLVLLVLVAIWFMVNRAAGGTDAAAAKEQAPVVSVLTPGSGMIEGTINATGTLPPGANCRSASRAKAGKCCRCWSSPASGSAPGRRWR